MLNNISYDYQKSENTYTLEQYIACQSSEDICYHNLSFIENKDNIDYDIHNIVNDYIDELRAYSKIISFNSAEYQRYKYRPKLLCYDLYREQELSFIILLINDMCSAKEFIRSTILLPSKNSMVAIVKALYNANKNEISIYNKKNN